MTDRDERRTRARPRETGARYVPPRRRPVDAEVVRYSVGVVAYLFSTSLPCTPTHTSPPGEQATAEEVLAALVADSARWLRRGSTRTVYEAFADAIVLPTDPTPGADDAPEGWYAADVLVVVGSYRPWSADTEQDAVTADAYRAARDAVLGMWPIPADWMPTAMPLDLAEVFRLRHLARTARRHAGGDRDPAPDGGA